MHLKVGQSGVRIESMKASQWALSNSSLHSLNHMTINTFIRAVKNACSITAIVIASVTEECHS